MRKRTKAVLAVFIVIPIIAGAGLFFYFSTPSSKLLCQVWSENSPYGQRTEFKVNWKASQPISTEEDLIDCWLYDIDEVKVTAPDNSVHLLSKDFNINSYSGEATQRWVLYGAQGLGLPPTGEYRFTFIKNGEKVAEKTIKYTQALISYPTGVEMARQGANLAVSWIPPGEIDNEMWYKVIVESLPNTSATFFSQIFEWDASEAVLPDVPLEEGGSYRFNVAVFFDDGYAYSEYVYFTWTE